MWQPAAHIRPPLRGFKRTGLGIAEAEEVLRCSTRLANRAREFLGAHQASYYTIKLVG